MSSDLNTGSISLRFEWLETKELNPLQFYNLFERKFSRYLNPGYGSEEEHSEYVSKNDFVKIAEKDFKTMLGLRQYKKYPKLYDLVFNAALMEYSSKGFLLKLSLTGISKENGLAFLRKFLETIQWQN